MDGKTLEEWKLNPGHLLRPDIKGSAATGLGKDGEQSARKVQKEIEELTILMAATPGYESLAKNAQEILNFRVSTSDDSDWYLQVFNDFPAWVLIYLDGLETNLCRIKLSSSATKNPV